MRATRRRSPARDRGGTEEHDGRRRVRGGEVRGAGVDRHDERGVRDQRRQLGQTGPAGEVRLVGQPGPSRRSAAARSRSAAEPVSTTWQPVAGQGAATAANRSAGQDREPYAAPTWTTTAPGAGLGTPGGGRAAPRRVAGDAVVARGARPSGRVRSTSSTQAGPSQPGGLVTDAVPRAERVEQGVALRTAAVQVHGDVDGADARQRRASRPVTGSRVSTAPVRCDDRSQPLGRGQHDPVLGACPAQGPQGGHRRPAGRPAPGRAARGRRGGLSRRRGRRLTPGPGGVEQLEHVG